MATDEESYYNSLSKSESAAMAFWCFVACAILAVLGMIYGLWS